MYNPQGAAGGKRVAKKILAKSGDAAFQYEILKAGSHTWAGAACGVSMGDMMPYK